MNGYQLLNVTGDRDRRLILLTQRAMARAVTGMTLMAAGLLHSLCRHLRRAVQAPVWPGEPA